MACMGSGRSLYIVIPMFNESDVLTLLFDQLTEVFSAASLQARGIAKVRFLFVDDGSSDDSAAQIANRIRLGWNGIVVCLSRNFGHQAAVAAGLDHTEADLVAVMDADLQDPPRLILDMVQR